MFKNSLHIVALCYGESSVFFRTVPIRAVSTSCHLDRRHGQTSGSGRSLPNPEIAFKHHVACIPPSGEAVELRRRAPRLQSRAAHRLRSTTCPGIYTSILPSPSNISNQSSIRLATTPDLQKHEDIVTNVLVAAQSFKYFKSSFEPVGDAGETLRTIGMCSPRSRGECSQNMPNTT